MTNLSLVLFALLVISLQKAHSTSGKHELAAAPLAPHRAQLQTDKKNCKPCKEPQKPICVEKQEVAETIDDCGCKQWLCVWFDCSHFKFDPKKPNVKCSDCSEIPTVREDCGCKKWECARRPCDGPENKKRASCKSECDRVLAEEDCGCTKYSCVPSKPPKEKCSDVKCGKCERCVEKPWISKKCGIKEPVCERYCPKRLKPTCTECEDLIYNRGECGCYTTFKCVPRKIKDSCSVKGRYNCSQCQTCVTTPHKNCPNGGTKTCQRKDCPIPKKLRCKACEEKIKGADKCNCATETCKPKKCKTPSVVPVCTNPCHEAVLEKNSCGCKVYICKPKKPISKKPTTGARCKKECGKCHHCQWVRNEECKTWETECVRKCKKAEKPENRHCFEEMEYDNCECPLPLIKKPCIPLPHGDCPKGKVKVPGAVDCCGCRQPNTCVDCVPFDRSTCNSCQDAVINPGPCPTGHCLQKPCPKAEKTCGPCKEKKVVFNKCNCPVVTCVKHCGPKKPCPKGEKEVGTKKDSCGCPVRKCIPPPTTGCTTTEVCVGKVVCTKWKCVGKCVAKKNGYWFF